MGDSDNPIGGLIGMVVMISVLPMILEMLGGLTGGNKNQGQGSFVPLGGERFGVTAPMSSHGYNFFPGREYSTGGGQFNTPIDLSAGPRAQGGPATFADIAQNPFTTGLGYR